MVEKEPYLLELARYIVLNPVRAHMVRSAKDWPWSSYRATAGFKESEKWLTIDWVLSSFSSKKMTAVKLYREFVSAGRNQPKPWEQLRNQIYLGSDEFVDDMQCKISLDTKLSEIPSTQKRQVAKPISFYVDKFIDRNTAIIQAYASGAYSMKDIGEYFEIHYSRVSRIIKAKDKT